MPDGLASRVNSRERSGSKSDIAVQPEFLMRAANESFREMLRRCRRQYPHVHLTFVRDGSRNVILLAYNDNGAVAYNCSEGESRSWLLGFEFDARSGAFADHAPDVDPARRASPLLGKRLY